MTERLRHKRLGDVEVIREPLVDGCVDSKTGEPIHAVQLEGRGPIYMVPKFYDRLKAEIDTEPIPTEDE
jgi:hypothetical protein